MGNSNTNPEKSNSTKNRQDNNYANLPDDYETLKHLCEHIYLRGYCLGKNVEEPNRVAKRTARHKFSRYWEHINNED